MVTQKFTGGTLQIRFKRSRAPQCISRNTSLTNVSMPPVMDCVHKSRVAQFLTTFVAFNYVHRCYPRITAISYAKTSLVI